MTTPIIDNIEERVADVKSLIATGKKKDLIVARKKIVEITKLSVELKKFTLELTKAKKEKLPLEKPVLVRQ